MVSTSGLRLIKILSDDSVAPVIFSIRYGAPSVIFYSVPAIFTHFAETTLPPVTKGLIFVYETIADSSS